MKADQPTVHPNARESIAYAELLKLAHDEGLKSIATSLLLQPSEENGRLAIVKATVETERGPYEGLGDADPGNVEPFLAPHLIRVAETRTQPSVSCPLNPTCHMPERRDFARDSQSRTRRCRRRAGPIRGCD